MVPQGKFVGLLCHEIPLVAVESATRIWLLDPTGNLATTSLVAPTRRSPLVSMTVLVESSAHETPVAVEELAISLWLSEPTAWRTNVGRDHQSGGAASGPAAL